MHSEPVSTAAVIDIGTNSVLLLVARAHAGSPEVLVDRAEVTRLGEGVDLTGSLSLEAMDRTFAMLREYVQLARQHGAHQVRAVATSAMRSARNQGAFTERIRRELDLEVVVIGGDREASLSFAAAHRDFGYQGPLMVIDIGGGSTEVVSGTPNGTITSRQSLEIGSVRLTERYRLSTTVAPSPTWRELDVYLSEQFARLARPAACPTLVGIAGTVTSLCAFAKHTVPYDGNQIHGAILTVDEVTRVTHQLRQMTLAERLAHPALHPKRADVLPVGCSILLEAMRRLGSTSVTVSDRGLRWGLWFETISHL